MRQYSGLKSIKVSQLVTLKDITPLLDQLKFCSYVTPPRFDNYEKLQFKMSKN